MISARDFNKLLVAVGHDDRCPESLAVENQMIGPAVKHLSRHLQAMRAAIDETERLMKELAGISG